MKRKPNAASAITIAFIGAASGLSAFFVFFPITDTDIFWHLAAGREMARFGHFLYTDPFSFTLASPEWVDLHWCFQLIVYGLHSLGGETALLAFKLCCVASTVALLCRVHENKRYAVITAFVAIVLMYNARYLICLRPVLITMLCMAVYFLVFERARRIGNDRLLWLCIPLQVLWTNSQGLYMIGLFIIGAYWIERVVDWRRKRARPPVAMTLLLSGAAAACFLNPWGVRGVLLPLTLFGRTSPAADNIYSMNIAENVPLFALTGYESLYAVVVVVTAIVLCILLVLNRDDLRPAHYLLLGGFLFLAWRAERNVLLYVIAVMPIIGYHASECAALRRIGATLTKTRGKIGALTVVAITVAGLFVFRHAMVMATFPPQRTLSPFRFPEKICEHLEKHPCDGRMFNDIRHGGYLIWKLYPQKQVFIDGRLIIRSPEFFREYLMICANPALFSTMAEKFDITHVVLPWAIFALHRDLIAWLYRSDKWQLEYTDGASLLFVRGDHARFAALRLDTPATVDRICDGIAAQWCNAPYVRREAIGYFAEMLDSLTLHDMAAAARHRQLDVK